LPNRRETQFVGHEMPTTMLSVAATYKARTSAQNRKPGLSGSRCERIIGDSQSAPSRDVRNATDHISCAVAVPFCSLSQFPRANVRMRTTPSLLPTPVENGPSCMIARAATSDILHDSGYWAGRAKLSIPWGGERQRTTAHRGCRKRPPTGWGALLPEPTPPSW